MRLVEQLSQQVEVELDRIRQAPLVEQFATARVDRARYQRFLTDLYPVVAHFCPVMLAAAARCPDELSAVRSFLYEHAREEKGHELWVLEDCCAIGGPSFMEQVRLSRPAGDVQEMMEFNHALAEREHPCGVLGMVLALEAMAERIAGGAAAAASRALQLEDGRGVKFLASHGPLDACHLDELYALLDTLEDRRAAPVIADAVRVNFRLFGAAFG
jgi:pyrroloquinoline quinone (PQQ) biosynthesis protein C